jgi:hypothetical protein
MICFRDFDGLLYKIVFAGPNTLFSLPKSPVCCTLPSLSRPQPLSGA